MGLKKADGHNMMYDIPRPQVWRSLNSLHAGNTVTKSSRASTLPISYYVYSDSVFGLNNNYI